MALMRTFTLSLKTYKRLRMKSYATESYSLMRRKLRISEAMT